MDAIGQTQTADSGLLPVPTDTFEKLYLSPKNPYKTQRLTQRFGNPTPISLIGVLMASSRSTSPSRFRLATSAR